MSNFWGSVQIDAEVLPFEDESFDLVYSWGVIHHSKHPDFIIQEIKRVLKNNGSFIGMMYGRRSLLALKLWVKHALFQGKLNRSLQDVIWHHMESIGTKAYTPNELREIFSGFKQFNTESIITPYDKNKFPKWISKFFPGSWGWFIIIKAVK